MYKTALITFKTVSAHQPPYLSSHLVPHNPSRSLHSANLNYLTVPRVTSALQSRAFSVSAPLSLASPDSPPSFLGTASETVYVSQLESFKRNLKTYLFDALLLVAT